MWQNMALKFLLAHTFTEALIATFDQKFRQGLSFMIKIMKIVKTENFTTFFPDIKCLTLKTIRGEILRCQPILGNNKCL